MILVRSATAQITTVVNVPPASAPTSIYSGTRLNVAEGGLVSADTFRAYSGSEVTTSGGMFAGILWAWDGSVVQLAGGAQKELWARSGSSVLLIGDEFRVDGQAVTGLEQLGNQVSLDLPVGAALTGVYADGTPFAFIEAGGERDSIADGVLTLKRASVAPPGAGLITASTDPIPLGINAGQTLLVDDGGAVSDNFAAGPGSTVLVETGGTIGENFEVVGGAVTVQGGVVGNGLDLFSGSVIDVNGGRVEGASEVFAEGVMRMAGGRVQYISTSRGGSTQIHGGLVEEVVARTGGQVEISGALVADLSTDEGGEVRLRGGEFWFNGAPLAGLDEIGQTEAIDTTSPYVLTGILSDGTPIAFSSSSRDYIAAGTLTLEAADVQTPSPGVFYASAAPSPAAIGVGQTLVVDSGSQLDDSLGKPDGIFRAGPGSRLVLEDEAAINIAVEVAGGGILDLMGGEVRNRVTAYHRSVVNLHHGEIFSLQSFYSETNIYGGTIDHELLAATESTVHLRGDVTITQSLAEAGSRLNGVSGTVEGERFETKEGSRLDVAGSTISAQIVKLGGATYITGGAVVGENRIDVYGPLHLSAGSISPLRAYAGSEVNISGGMADHLWIDGGSEVTISAGIVGDDVSGGAGSVIRVLGGVLGSGFRSSGEVVISGGKFGPDFFASDASEVTISGGVFGDNLHAASNSRVKLVGDRFRLDGTPISGLELPGDAAGINVPAGSVLSGTLLDGSPFAFSSYDSDEFASNVLTLEVGELTPLGATEIVVPRDPVPTGLRGGQTLWVEDGGAVGNHFGAAPGAAMHVQPGGEVGDNFEAVGAFVEVAGGTIGDDFAALVGSDVSISAGSVGQRFFVLDSNVQLFDGTIGKNFVAERGAVVAIRGGQVRSGGEARDGSRLEISGGRVDALTALAGAAVDIRGGHVHGLNAVGSDVSISGGTLGDDLYAHSGVSVTLIGGEFFVDDNAIAGLDVAGDLLEFDLPTGSALHGILADGTPIILSRGDGDWINSGSLTLQAAPLPVVNPSLLTASTDSLPRGVRQGQTLLVDDGGAVPDNFRAGRGSIVFVQAGGVVGDHLETADAAVAVAGGAIGDNFDAFARSDVTIVDGQIGRNATAQNATHFSLYGGAIGERFEVRSGSELTVLGGSVGGDLSVEEGRISIQGGAVAEGMTADRGSVVDISGGRVGSNFLVSDRSEANVSGGSVGPGLTFEASALGLLSGGTFADGLIAEPGSMVTLAGADFRVDGIPLAGLENEGDEAPFALSEGALLTGVFSDGVPFAFSMEEGDELSEGAVLLRRTSLPPAAPTTIVASADPVPHGIREGQTLIVDAGAIVGDDMNLGRQSVLEVQAGGTVGNNLEAVGATVEIAGEVGEHFDAWQQSSIHIVGGSLAHGASIRDSAVVLSDGTASSMRLERSDLTLLGGFAGGLVTARSGSAIHLHDGALGSVDLYASRIDVSGGELLAHLTVEELGEANISGGVLHRVTALNGSVVTIADDAHLTYFEPRGGSVSQISGGFFDREVDGASDTSVHISGGVFAGGFATSGNVEIQGGAFSQIVSIRAGGDAVVSGGLLPKLFAASSGSSVELRGGDFLVDNQPLLVGLPGESMPLVIGRDSVLSGFLSDGTPFVMNGDRIAATSLVLKAAELPPVLPAQWIASRDGAPPYLGRQQSLRVDVDDVLGDGFIAGQGSTLVVEENGSIGDDLRLVAATLQSNGGMIGNGLEAYHGSHLSIVGGSIGQDVVVAKESVLNITGGKVGSLRLTESEANIAGGAIGEIFVVDGGELVFDGGSVDELRAYSSGVAHLSGGVVGELRAEAGSELHLRGGAFGKMTASSLSVSIHGADFYLDDVPIDGLENPGNSVETTVSGWSVLSGNLADGTPFAFSALRSDYLGTLTLVRAELPAIDTTPRVASAGDLPLGLREGQLLTVDAGGVVADRFRAGRQSELVVDRGGVVGNDLEAIGAAVRLAGGEIGQTFRAFAESRFVMTEGRLGSLFYAHSGSNVEIHGGVVADHMHIASGSRLDLFGGEFYVDGQPIAGLADPGAEVSIELPFESTLSGVLSDGTPFAFSSFDHDSIQSETLTLHRTELPPIGPTEFIASSDSLPAGIRAGQSLVVDAGGEVGDNFMAGRQSMVTVEPGGIVGENLEIVGSEIFIQGGAVGRFFDAFAGSVVHMSGGTVGSRSLVGMGSTLNISGGEVGHLLEVEGGVVNMSGGMIGQAMELHADAVFNMTGGQFVDYFSANAGSEAHFFGTEFFVDGQPLLLPSLGQPQAIEVRRGILTGRLADGSQLAMNLYGRYGFTSDVSPDALVTVTRIAGTADFTGDLNVDADDLAVWQSSFGQAAAADADSNGQSNGRDFVLWQRQQRSPIVGSDFAPTPEPSAAYMMACILTAITLRRRRPGKES